MSLSTTVANDLQFLAMQDKANSTVYDDINRIDRCDVLKFECDLVSVGYLDVHRRFAGGYFPRWRALFLDEIRVINKVPRLFPAYKFGVYRKPGNEDFLSDDFQVGLSFSLGTPMNQRDEEAKSFVITSVDDSKLAVVTAPTHLTSTRTMHRSVAPAVDSSVVAILSKVRDALIGCSSLGASKIGLKSSGRARDVRRPLRLDRGSLAVLLRETKVALTTDEVKKLFREADPGNTGYIDVDAIQRVLRPPMPPSREHLLREVFRRLDMDGDGCLTKYDIEARYKAELPPPNNKGGDGRVSGTEALTESLGNTLASYDPRDAITFAEFKDYYDGVSAAVSDDTTFRSIVEGSWHLEFV